MLDVGMVEDVVAVSTSYKEEVLCCCGKEGSQQGCLARVAYRGGRKASVDLGFLVKFNSIRK